MGKIAILSLLKFGYEHMLHTLRELINAAVTATRTGNNG